MYEVQLATLRFLKAKQLLLVENGPLGVCVIVWMWVWVRAYYSVYAYIYISYACAHYGRSCLSIRGCGACLHLL